MNTKDRISYHLTQGRSAKLIADMEGLDVEVVYRYIRDIDPNYKPTAETGVFGLTADTMILRANLAALLQDMQDLSMREIARITGLNQREQRRAAERPWNHNWTLSQMERLLSFHNLQLKDVL